MERTRTTTKGHGRPSTIDQIDIITRDIGLEVTMATTRATRLLQGKRNSEEGGEHRNSGYHRIDDSGGERSRNFDPSPEDILNGPCHINYTYLDGKKVSIT
jgi:hypothetical protein